MKIKEKEAINFSFKKVDDDTSKRTQHNKNEKNKVRIKCR